MGRRKGPKVGGEPTERISGACAARMQEDLQISQRRRRRANGPPVCYSCGVKGHFATLCQRKVTSVAIVSVYSKLHVVVVIIVNVESQEDHSGQLVTKHSTYSVRLALKINHDTE